MTTKKTKAKTKTRTEIGGFLDELARQGLAERTQACYASDLAHFTRWFAVSNGEDLSAERVTPTDVRGYKAHQQTVQNLKPATINRRLATLRKFFLWAKAQGLIAGLPTDDVSGVPTVPTAPRSLSRQDLNKLTRAAEQDALRPGASWYARRNLAIIQVLRYTGVRVGELSALHLLDLEMSERKDALTVRSGKGGKFREVPLGVEARRPLQDYLDHRPDIPDDHVFVGQRGVGLSPEAVADVVKKYADRAGLENVTPHVLRHSFGRGLVDAGVDLVSVATLLGHERLETTALYTRPSGGEDLRRAVEKLEAG